MGHKSGMIQSSAMVNTQFMSHFVFFAHTVALALRIEWCKSRARAMRWKEEVILLQEEMRRVLAFLTAQATVWRERAAGSEMRIDNTNTRRHANDSAIIEGRRAYAKQQALLRLDLKAHFEKMWRYVGSYVRSGTGELFPPEMASEDQ